MVDHWPDIGTNVQDCHGLSYISQGAWGGFLAHQISYHQLIQKHFFLEWHSCIYNYLWDTKAYGILHQTLADDVLQDLYWIADDVLEDFLNFINVNLAPTNF